MAVTGAIIAVATVASVVEERKAGETQKESNAVSTASQKIQDRNALKQKQREQTIRAAQIKQAASSTGVSMSSGEIGALGGLQTMYSGMVAQMKGQEKAADAITALNNKRAGALSRSNTYQAVNSLATLYGTMG